MPSEGHNPQLLHALLVITSLSPILTNRTREQAAALLAALYSAAIGRRREEYQELVDGLIAISQRLIQEGQEMN